MLPKALQALSSYKQFLLWELVPDKDIPEKFTKIPISPKTLKPCGVRSYDDMVTAEEAYSQVHRANGVAFVFTENDPFFFVDIDAALRPNKTWSPLAIKLCQEFAGCAVEISQSKTGLHIIGSYTSRPAHSCKDDSNHLELYTAHRFIALTGYNAQGDASTQATATLLKFIDKHVPYRDPGEAIDWGVGAVPEWSGPDDDDELLELMLASRSMSSLMFGKASFKDLWERNVEVLAENWPHPTKEFNFSNADASLVQHLAFWTGKNCLRIERLFTRSALARPKWNSRPEYRKATISRGVAICKDVYQEKQKPIAALTASVTPIAQPTEPTPNQHTLTGATQTDRPGHQILTISQQKEYFKDCFYVRDVHRVLVPDGSLIKPVQFGTQFGGYLFSVDNTMSKTTTDAWKAFTASQGCHFPKVHTTEVTPRLPFGNVREVEGFLKVNTFKPIITARTKGDATRFLDHLTGLLPDDRDRTILLSYMAACVQYKGVKFRWAPVLQGVMGNGKSLLVNCLKFAIGKRFCHSVNASDLGKNGLQFTGWLHGKLFIDIEEIYAPGDRNAVFEGLKKLITDDDVEIQFKGQDQMMGQNLANFMLGSNHQNSLRYTRNNRRYAPLFTAHQSYEDIKAAKWSGNYFPNIYRWLKNEKGYEIVNDYLMSYMIPDEFNPATNCHRAPTTSSSLAAAQASLGGAEQLIMEAVEQDAIGFRGGWISSMHLDKLLKDNNYAKKVPNNKRREMLNALGYNAHPRLRDGRANNAITIDGGKSRLYVVHDHTSRTVRDAAAVVKLYVKAQQAPI